MEKNKVGKDRNYQGGVMVAILNKVVRLRKVSLSR